MGSGTDIARETSKMIVMDDNFRSIVNGVLEGRVAYANIRKITYFLISCGLAEVLFFTLSIAFNMPMPLVAIQLLWLNVVTDGIQDIALSFEKAESDIMNKKPRDYEWYSDPQDTVTAGWGLCSSARDLAKLGELVLNEGRVDDKVIVSEEYIREMLTPRQKLGERFGNMEYGYLWYKPIEGKEVYVAIGDSGNIIYINKDKNISVGITGTFKPRIFDRVAFIETKVLSAM